MSSIAIPDLSLRYQLADTEIVIDPVEAISQIAEIARNRRDDGNFAYLDDFAAWVQAQTGVPINRSVADFLWDSVQSEYERLKKERRAGSPTS